MKRRLYSCTLEDQREALRINEIMEVRMQNIKCDFANYNICNTTPTAVSVFLYPEKEEFTPVEIAELKGLLIDEFQIEDEPFSKNFYRSWQRDFWNDDGTFYILRCLKQHLGGKIDLTLRIEQTPRLNCRVEKKTVEKVVYEAICD